MPKKKIRKVNMIEAVADISNASEEGQIQCTEDERYWLFAQMDKNKWRKPALEKVEKMYKKYLKETISVFTTPPDKHVQIEMGEGDTYDFHAGDNTVKIEYNKYGNISIFARQGVYDLPGIRGCCNSLGYMSIDTGRKETYASVEHTKSKVGDVSVRAKEDGTVIHKRVDKKDFNVEGETYFKETWDVKAARKARREAKKKVKK